MRIIDRSGMVDTTSTTRGRRRLLVLVGAGEGVDDAHCNECPSLV